jgi:beta-glucosidase
MLYDFMSRSLRIGCVTILAVFGLITGCQETAVEQGRDIGRQVQELMAQMTLEEKIGQMCQYVAPLHIEESKKRMQGDELIHNDQWGLYPGMSADSLRNMVKTGHIGSFLHVKDATEANELQKLALESRLKIPLLIGIDAIHGHAMIEGTTVYPTQMGLSSTWDNDLLFRVAQATAKEVRATGMHWTFSPNVDVARDPRWGRTGETFGEDPFMVTQMGLAFTRGYEGDLGEQNVLACAKHYIAGSEPYNGTNASPMDVSMRQLREIWLPPYRAQAETGVYTFMAAHNELNGVPCHSSTLLLNDILREEWGFEGFVVSDWMDIERVETLHHVAEDISKAVKLAVTAGMDMHMHGPVFLETLAELVRAGEVPEKRIDEACSKVLKAKFLLGLFEDPLVEEETVEENLFTAEHQELAREAARKSIILLKNEQNLLPLSSPASILVTGPNANNHRILGDWVLPQPEDNVVTVYEGIRDHFEDARVKFMDSGESLRNPQDLPDEIFAEAARAEVVIAVVGSNSLRYDKHEKTSGENVGRSRIDLLGNQLELVQRLYAANERLIVIFVNGRQLSEPWIRDNVPAIIEAWEPGSFGGQAVAEILAGDVNPSGKLTVTFPFHAGQLPMVYNHKPSVFFHKYIDAPSEPLWPFGYGMSYTSFQYSDLILDKNEIEPGEKLNVRVTLKNTGNLPGEEVVQLYLRDQVSSVTRPVKELKGYQRVALQPGTSAEVKFEITEDLLAFWDINMQYAVEKGTFEVMIGSSSRDQDLLKDEFELTTSKVFTYK